MSRFRSVTTAIAVLLLATPLAAQSTATRSTTTNQDTTAASALPAPSSVAPSAVVIDRVPTAQATPSWMNATVAPARTAQTSVARAFDSGSSRESGALMIVGGAGVLVGAIVGGSAGTIIMVGGTVVGLIGLWNYVK
jgi:hypothetical protein